LTVRRRAMRTSRACSRRHDESAAELRGAMERLHGPPELVPWQSKRTDALTNRRTSR
jgi:hypothetical protein